MEEKPDIDKIAIALGYNQEKDIAPRVLATGKGFIAEKILEIAKAKGITIHSDKELAKILSLLDVDSVIPIEAYAAVADILSYIYEMNKKYKNKE